MRLHHGFEGLEALRISSIFQKDSGGFECSGEGEAVGCFDCILKSGRR
ncbi:hypothetical protein ES319_D01G158500v1 [Gossypium barbadense]|uniref:Uncharacterized protein n=2 Tax=Gossypium TaxID=3633 RepID=A0A5J5SPS4_GOSBA|nr:hypothetical protein ES319_D01G158500v1 [Gossypium barbadense]TYG83487.1 hypothetical protein ES288_D01G171500v1 [Gossypium darwinii]